MRVAIVGTRGIPARYGGFETMAMELSGRLAERGHDVTVLTRANNRSVIEKGLESLKGSHPDFIYYDLPKWMIWLKKRL